MGAPPPPTLQLRVTNNTPYRPDLIGLTPHADPLMHHSDATGKKEGAGAEGGAFLRFCFCLLLRVMNNTPYRPDLIGLTPHADTLMHHSDATKSASPPPWAPSHACLLTFARASPPSLTDTVPPSPLRPPLPRSAGPPRLAPSSPLASAAMPPRCWARAAPRARWRCGT